MRLAPGVDCYRRTAEEADRERKAHAEPMACETMRQPDPRVSIIDRILRQFDDQARQIADLVEGAA